MDMSSGREGGGGVNAKRGGKNVAFDECEVARNRRYDRSVLVGANEIRWA